jgi:hypothetical protein
MYLAVELCLSWKSVGEIGRALPWQFLSDKCNLHERLLGLKLFTYEDKMIIRVAEV